MGTLASIMAILMLSVSSTFLQWLGFMLYVLSRVTTYGTFFAYIGINFGFRFFGTLAGLGLLISAFFSLFQYFCLNIVTGPLDGDYKPMNEFFAIWCLIWGVLYSLYLLRFECSSLFSKSEASGLNPNASNYVIDPDGKRLDDTKLDADDDSKAGIGGGGAWD